MGFKLQGNKEFVHRTRLEIIFSILSMCRANSSARKTRIMYKSNLSYSQLQRYLAFLVSIGLLEKEKVEGADFFKLTKKGDEFLKEYQQIKRLLTVGPALSEELNRL